MESLIEKFNQENPDQQSMPAFPAGEKERKYLAKLKTKEFHKKLSERTFLGVRLPNVCTMFDASPATIWRWSKSNNGFPKPIQLSNGVTVWDHDELLDWVQNKKEQRITLEATSGKECAS